MAVPTLLVDLLRAHGPSGHEHLAFAAVRRGVEGVADVETDTVGNIVARRNGRGDGPLLAVFAHLDVIGLAVAHIPEDGLLPVHLLGTWQAGVGYGQRVEISTSNGAHVVPGVIAARSKNDEKKEWRDLYVDVGALDGGDARRFVAPGDPMVVVAPPLELANGRVASRSLDNRACVYVALEALRRLADEPAAADVAIVAGAHEELGRTGASAAMHRLRPDLSLVLDATYATDVPAGDANESGDHRLGSGPAIFRGPAVNPRVFDLLVDTAEAEGIAHTIETGMRTYTDADDTHLSRAGVATGLVSVPLRNMHSGIEMVDLGDLEACVRLVTAFARRLDGELDLRR